MRGNAEEEASAAGGRASFRPRATFPTMEVSPFLLQLLAVGTERSLSREMRT